jgi:hydrogenase maturation protein HypF
MADNGLESPVIGVAFDGTGMGADGNIWGGEFLVADYRNFRRAGHLEYLPLPGGTAAIKRPYRTAIGYILTLLGQNALNHGLPIMKAAEDIEIDVIMRQIEKKINSPLCSSVGRLFDAISALVGIRNEIDYEGQAAVELEMAAHSFTMARNVNDELISDNNANYPYRIVEDDGVRIVRLKDLFSAVIDDLYQGVSKGMISVKFHNTVAQMVNDTCHLIAEETGIIQVALSGGVFQNRLLLRKTVSLLESNGFQVFTHRQVPCNDGGISLGQAMIANFAV